MADYPIPEDLQARYARAKSALEYGQCSDPTTFKQDIALIERIATLEAEVARLKAPVDDETEPLWPRIWDDSGPVMHVSVDVVNAIIASRAQNEVKS